MSDQNKGVLRMGMPTMQDLQKWAKQRNLPKIIYAIDA